MAACVKPELIRNILSPTLDLSEKTWCRVAHPFVKSLQIRFRKPRSMGRAPSKDPSYFAKHWPTVRDSQKNQALYASYNASLQSIVAAFQEELVAKQQSVVDVEGQGFTWDEEGHHAKCMQYNNEENKRMQNKRFDRLEKARQLMVEKQKQQEFTSQTKLSALRNVNKEVLEELKEQSKFWITEENCEEKVTEAVDNPVNPNFAVDFKGFIIRRTAQIV